MANRAFYENDALKRILAGAEELYRQVATTYGPKGRNVVIDSEYDGVHITHDGVTVARSVDIPVTEETLGYMTGVKLIRRGAEKLNSEVADATTTVTILTYHILNEAYKLVAAGYNPMVLRREIEAAAKVTLPALDKMAKKVKDLDQLREVATISVGGDSELGATVADVIHEVGADGVVTVENSTSGKDEIDISQGYTFDRGWSSPHFITNLAKQEAVIENPDIILTDEKIESQEQLKPIFDKLKLAKRSNIVIITAEITNDMLAMMVINKVQHKANVAVVKAPAFGNVQANTLDDIGFLIGATPASRQTGRSLESLEANDVGTATRIIISREKTTIVGGGGSKKLVKARLDSLTKEIKSTESEYEKEKLIKRKAALAGKAAIIRAGGVDEGEIKERKDRIDDAVGASRAALSEGIVAGGGVTLLGLANKVPGNTSGAAVLRRALEKPFIQLVDNAGESGEALLREASKFDSRYGFNIMDLDAGVINLFDAGIIDPVKATRMAVEQAVAIASLAITMGALSVPEPVKE